MAEEEKIHSGEEAIAPEAKPALTSDEKKKQKNIGKNYLYNLAYNLFLIIVPLVVTPYLSRVLQNDGIGINSFVLTINTYFTMFASFGFGYYAQREIAKHQGNKQRQSNTFWEIMFAKGLTSALSFGLYFLMTFTVPVLEVYRSYLLIYSCTILMIALDTSFMFSGNEDFKQISLRTILVRTVEIALVFIFVKKNTDLWIYVLIYSVGSLGNSIILFPFLRKYLVKPNAFLPTRHFIPSLRLFIPALATSLYSMLDKAMIGFLIPSSETMVEMNAYGQIVIKKVSEVQSGYYQQADKIVRMLLTVITALGSVMTPRNTELIRRGQEEEAKKNVMKSVRFVFFLGVPMALGLVAISRTFVPWFFGMGYQEVTLLMIVLSALILLAGLTSIFGMQYLIPKEKDTAFTIAAIAGALLNLGLNFLLIPHIGFLDPIMTTLFGPDARWGFGANGAAWASILAEAFVLFWQIWFVRKDFKWREVFFSSWRSWIAGLTMAAVVIPLGFLLPYGKVENFPMWMLILVTFGVVLAGILVYGFMEWVLKDQMFFLAVRKIKEKVQKFLPKKKAAAAAAALPGDGASAIDEKENKSE